MGQFINFVCRNFVFLERVLFVSDTRPRKCFIGVYGGGRTAPPGKTCSNMSAPRGGNLLYQKRLRTRLIRPLRTRFTNLPRTMRSIDVTDTFCNLPINISLRRFPGKVILVIHFPVETSPIGDFLFVSFLIQYLQLRPCMRVRYSVFRDDVL